MNANGIRMILFTAAAAFLSRPQLSAATYITAQKEHVFVQDGIGSTVADPTNPFQFYAQSPLAGGFTPPGGTSAALVFIPSTNKYEYLKYFSTQAQLDASYPDGSYTFSVTGSPSFNLSLTGDDYPNTPEVTNGTWNASGDYVIDPTQNATLTFNTFSAYGTTPVGSYMQVSITGFDSNTVDLVQSSVTPTNESPFTSFSIPAGTLAPGSIYLCLIEFDNVSAVNNTTVSGQTAATDYTVITGIKIVTTGKAPNPPVITLQPTSQTVGVGANVTLSLGFSGATEFQWFKNGTAISNTNNPNGTGLALLNVQSSDAGSYYAVVVASNGNYAQTNTVTLSVGTSAAVGPAYKSQPQSETVASGSTVAFTAEAVSSPAPTYQWYFGGEPLTNGNGVNNVTGQTLVITGATAANAGAYYCVASNPSGSTPSDMANLTVVATTNPGRLINLSILSNITGSLSMGFVTGGAGTSGLENLLIRGVGPSIGPGTAFDVPGVITDPTLTVVQQTGDVIEATNSGWGNPAGNVNAVETADAATGAFALTNPASLDSAVVVSLPSVTGGYSATVAGKSGDNGYALTEVYDDTSSYTSASTRLINLSCLTQIASGGTLDVGFVIGGVTAKTVLVRVGGPALKTLYGVAGVMPDPQLQVSPLSSSTTVLAFNAGWGGDPEIASVASSVGAYAFPNANGLDSAALVTLPPGAYTVQVNSTSGDGGTVLVEIYDVP